ncbi:MAG: GNAT family N-acetyltransferase [Alphaproteobacteria bacterium]
MKTIETPRLILRPMEREDVPAYAAIRSDPQVIRWLPGGADKAGEGEAIAAQRIPQFLDLWKQQGFGIWGLFERRGGALVGHCGLNRVDEFGEVEVLYALARAAWGQGLASEAAGATLAFGFGPVGLKRVIGLVRPENTGSRKVLEKLGMTYKHDVTFAAMRVRYYQKDKGKR